MLDLPAATDLIVAVDCEASGLHPDDGARVSVLSLAWDGGCRVYPFDQGYEPWLGPKQYPKRYPGPSLFDRDENLGLAEWDQLMVWLADQQLVFHNAQYDLTIIDAGLRNMSHTGVDLSPAFIWDTMVTAPIVWPHEKVSLDHLGQVILGRGKQHVEALNAWKTKYLPREDRGRYDLIPTDLILPYAAEDPQLTLELFYAQNRAMDEGEAAWEAVDREIDLALVLYHMQRTGVGFDVAGCRAQDRQLAALERRQLAALAKIVNTLDPTEDTMRRYWYDELSIKVTKRTDEGKPQVTADVVRELVAAKVPGAVEWQALTKTRTARKMWYSAWPELAGPDDRLRPIFRQTKSPSDQHDDASELRGTISGRLAVQRWQAQAIPHDYQIPTGTTPLRKLFQARPGHVLVEIDVSQAEMRAVAGLSRCHPLLQQFAAGVDAHTATATMVFNLKPGDEGWDFHRNVSKRLNFGIVYGAGVHTLREQIRMWTGYDAPEDEVAGWWNDAKRAMPEIFRMSWRLQRQAEATRQIELVGQRVRYFAPWEQTHKAMNALIQGSVAVAMADSMIDIHEMFGPGRLLLQIHDSVVLELPVNRADTMTAQAKGIICSTFERHFRAPFIADHKAWTT